MKRYNLNAWRDPMYYMVEDENGQWVKWDDVKKAVEKQTAKPMARITGMERVAEVYQEEVCPVCRAKPHYEDDLYCANCGQRLGVEG